MVAGRSPAGGLVLRRRFRYRRLSLGSLLKLPLLVIPCRCTLQLPIRLYRIPCRLAPQPAPWGRRTRHRRPAPRYRPGCSAGESRRGTWRSGRPVCGCVGMVQTFRALAPPAVCSSLLMESQSVVESVVRAAVARCSAFRVSGARRVSLVRWNSTSCRRTAIPSIRRPEASVSPLRRSSTVGRLRQQEDHLVGAAGPVPDGFRHRVRLVPHDGRPQYPAVVLEREGHAPGETDEVLRRETRKLREAGRNCYLQSWWRQSRSLRLTSRMTLPRR